MPLSEGFEIFFCILSVVCNSVRCLEIRCSIFGTSRENVSTKGTLSVSYVLYCSKSLRFLTFSFQYVGLHSLASVTDFDIITMLLVCKFIGLYTI
jgi:hypothetical protein